MRSLVRLLFGLVLSTLALGLVRDASACGAFAARPSEGQLAKSLPFLTVEQVLLVWNGETETEDFIREARFDKANASFGFVVPTPSKPEVAGIAKPPFDELRKTYPFEDRAPGRGKAGDLRIGGGAGAAAAPPVVVLSQERIGSFTAFTLAATDATAFDKWLHDNGFAMSEEAKPWLAHYLALKFFFVAFRYDAKPAQAPSMTSETVRIRFKTPAPYYPYLEPAHAPDAPHASRRMLTGWYVGPTPIAPVAWRGSPPERPWARPWSLGARYDIQDEDLKKALPDELHAMVPKGKVVVQPFLDQKTTRAGWGDVVLVPATITVSDKSALEKLRPLLPVVDPNLLLTDAELAQIPDPHFPVSAPLGQPTKLDPMPVPEPTPPPQKHGCSVSVPGASAGGALFCVALVVGVALRRRRLASLVAALALLCACRKPPPKSEPVAPPPPSASVAKPWWQTPHAEGPLSRDERETMALVLLAGGELDKIDEGTGLAALQAPLPQVTLAAAKSTVAIADLDRVIAGLRPRFRMCYTKGLQNDPAMAGKVTLALKIKPNGEVEAAEVAANTGISADVGKCLTHAAGNAQFDAPGGVGAHATVTITFAQ